MSFQQIEIGGIYDLHVLLLLVEVEAEERIVRSLHPPCFDNFDSLLVADRIISLGGYYVNKKSNNIIYMVSVSIITGTANP